MSRHQTVRYFIFVCVHFFPLIGLAAAQCMAGFGFLSATDITMFAIWLAITLAGAGLAFWLWGKFPSWLARVLAVDLAWCVTLAPFIFMAGGMGLGLGIAESGRAVTPLNFYTTLILGVCSLLFFAQIAIVPWTLFSVWVMGRVDRKLQN